MYDLLIIGSGPAGVSAALSAKARGLDFLWFGSRQLSPKIAKAERVMNYPGLPAVTGPEMREAFLRQVDSLGISVLEERVNSIYDMGGYYTAVVTDKMYDARTVILAPGVSNSREIPGESRLLGKGVSYCATCDGMLYRGREVVVVGLAQDAPEEAAMLSRIGCKVTYLAPKRPEELDAAIPFIKSGKLSILGAERVEGVLTDDKTLPCQGVFLLRDTIAPAALFPGLSLDGGYIRVDRTMATRLPGVFAAGDCTGLPLQIAKAVGEGQLAAHSAAQWLDAQKK